MRQERIQTLRISGRTINVKVEDDELGFLGAVAAAHGAHKFGFTGPDPPNNSA